MKTIAIIQPLANDDPAFFVTWLKTRGLPFSAGYPRMQRWPKISPSLATALGGTSH